LKICNGLAAGLVSAPCRQQVGPNINQHAKKNITAILQKFVVSQECKFPPNFTAKSGHTSGIVIVWNSVRTAYSKPRPGLNEGMEIPGRLVARTTTHFMPFPT
jgi:hypothetical protein